MGLILGTLYLSALLGFIVCVAVILPLTLYMAPYDIWLGFQQTRGMYKDISLAKGFFRNLCNATKVYISFFTKKAPALK